MITLKTHQTEVGWQLFVTFLLFILLIGNSLKKDAFQIFIRSKIYHREQSLLKSHKLTMEVDQYFATIFEQSQMVSDKVVRAKYLVSAKGQITSPIKQSTPEEET